MIDLKRITVPVFLIYAGIIHAIGLALLMPMLITLPGPGSMIASKAVPVAVELDAPEPDRERTSALPAQPQPLEANAAPEAAPPPAAPALGADPKPDIPGPVANIAPAGEPDGAQHKAPVVETPAKAAPQAKGKAKTGNAKPARSVNAPAAQHSAKPNVRRSAKKDTKIFPFGGGISGLFTPGAPAKRR